MVSEFTVFGSCTCRDIFNSTLNENYKDFFHIGKTGIRISFISLIQEPVTYSQDSLEIFPKIDKNVYFSNWIKNDLDKTFLDDLKNEPFEYLLIDTYYDTNFGIVDIGEGRYITNNIKLDQTQFYKDLEYKKILTIENNTKKYFDLWKKSCDLFFRFLDENCPDLVVILNPTRHVYKILKEDGSVIESNLFKKECKQFNKYRDMFDEYIVKNFDVEVLDFDEDIRAFEKNLWGCSSLHYEPIYFENVTNQLNEIILRNSSYSDVENIKIRQENREKLLLKINSRKKTFKNFIRNIF